jgi:hypothetical protein
MKKTIFIIVLNFIFISQFSWAQTKLYEHPKAREVIKTHQVVAILPFKTSISLRPKDMAQIQPEQLLRMEEAEGLNIQNSIYSWYLKRDKGDMNVKFLDPVTTNALLRRERITYENIADYTPIELAEILEVDAVIMGSLATSKPMSEGASVALAAIEGVIFSPLLWFGNGGPTNRAVVNMFLYNGSDGLLLVNYNKGVDGSLFQSPQELVNILMRKASRRLSYKG